jgi:Flp pilus assembly protein TadG
MLPSLVVTAARRFRPADRRRVGRGTLRRAGHRRGERGAVLVHAAVAMTGLLAFSALTIDLGTVWVARAQAQNAVDAAALSGAVSLAYGDPTNLDAAVASARAVAQTHSIWGDAITPALMTTTAGSCPAGAPGVTGDCVNVAVERGGPAGSPLPVFFSRMLGGTPTRMRASASAKVMLGNSTPCVRPIAIPDRWLESTGTWDYPSEFRPPDLYTRPDASAAGSGHTVGEMVGLRLSLERGLINPDDQPPQVLGDHYYALDLPRVGGEGLDLDGRYIQNILNCPGQALSIGDTVYTMGAHQILTRDAINELYNLDRGATWDGTKVVGVDPAYSVSPRIIELVLYDPAEFYATVRVTRPAEPDYRAPMTVRNIIGFFISEPMDGGTITGIVMPVPGYYNQAAPSVTQDAAFLRSVALVR